MIYSEIGRTS